MMDSKILKFLESHRVSSLTTLLQDGSPHASALHYSHKDEPLEIYFSTENTSRKCQSLIKGKATKGSVVVGFSEEEWITLQLDGEVNAVTDSKELNKIKLIHYSKHPESQKYENDPATLFLKFTPSWWRYTEFLHKQPKIISSDKQ